jgi:trehalose transport system permease protein
MVAPGLAVAALFAWLYSWNEFLYARLLTTSQNTLPLQVFQAIDRGTRQQMAAVAMILVLPILGVVAVLQRHLRPGALAGAIRG